MSVTKTTSGKTASNGLGGLMGLVGKPVKKTTSKTKEKVNYVFVENGKDAKNGEIVNAEVFKALTEAKEAKTMIETGTAMLASASNVIKTEGKSLFVKQVNNTKRVPESFILSNKAGDSGLFVVTKGFKYSNLDEERVEHITSIYGEETINTENKFSINPELVEKYGQVLCDLIMASKKIADEDKAQLIKLEQTVRINGEYVIDNLYELAEKTKQTVEAVINDLEPTTQLKMGAK